MKHGLIAVAMAGLIASGVALADTVNAQLVRTGGEWTISLDAQGRVERVRQTTTLKPLLAEPIERAIRGWSFEPGRIDGQPRPTETNLGLSIALQPVDAGGYAIRIDDVRVGGRIDKIPEMRVNPRDVREGTFLYVARVAYDEEGKVVSIDPERGTPEVPSGVRRSFERVLKGATFVPERVGGHGIAAEIVIPMCVSTTRGRRTSPSDACDWTPPHRSASIGGGQFVAVDSAAKLRTDVVGRTL